MRHGKAALIGLNFHAPFLTAGPALGADTQGEEDTLGSIAFATQKRAEWKAVLAVPSTVTEQWLVRGQLGVGYLLGDAADSPIVQEVVPPSVRLAIGHRF